MDKSGSPAAVKSLAASTSPRLATHADPSRTPLAWMGQRDFPKIMSPDILAFVFIVQ